MGTSAGQLSNSNVTVSSSTIISNPECSPFVIVCSEGNDGSSISFIDVVHRSSGLRTLLPLTAVSSLNHFTSSHLPCSEMNADVSVSCSGLSIDDTCLVLGTGPLLSLPYTPSTEQNEIVSTQLSVESSLLSSRLLNTTSLPRCSALPREVWLSQRIVGSCVGWSSNHLCGTGCVDMNSGGSLVCSNTSFSHCHSPLTPEHPVTGHSQLRHLPQQDHTDTNRTTLNTVTFSRSSKGAKLYNEQAVRHEDVVQAGVCTEGQLKRGIRAMNEHREIGVAHRPGKLTHSDEQELLTYCLEKIELDGHVKKRDILEQVCPFFDLSCLRQIPSGRKVLDSMKGSQS
ncbi:hypothetical protein BLNAU_4370 [Blattamonas nauphoetae]|uniref:Uncharacterized protein n=1 Tax=Blattamonas nauphoetae TaxID=2049346 RepID=A0ABQ9YAD4_9EUKA|nr:hypothetical protein BLNAU_4370 [Blattamonas nauphoetae]